MPDLAFVAKRRAQACERRTEVVAGARLRRRPADVAARAGRRWEPREAALAQQRAVAATHGAVRRVEQVEGHAADRAERHGASISAVLKSKRDYDCIATLLRQPA